jgi:hypothetical protein
MLRTIGPDDPSGMVFELGQAGLTVTAPIAPGIVETVTVENPRLMTPGDEVALVCTPCVVALDGEREVEIKSGQRATIRLAADGPVIVDVNRTMRLAMQNKIFAPENEKNSAAIPSRWN